MGLWTIETIGLDHAEGIMFEIIDTIDMTPIGEETTFMRMVWLIKYLLVLYYHLNLYHLAREPYREKAVYRDYAAPPPPALIAPNVDDRDVYDKQPTDDYPVIFVSPSRMVHIKPVMTYGKFVKSQRKDLSPEIYLKRFQDFQYNNLLDLALELTRNLVYEGHLRLILNDLNSDIK